MLLLLFAFQYFTMYLACQMLYFSFVQPNTGLKANFMESMLVSTVCTAITCILGEKFPTAFVRLLVTVMEGVYHHLRRRRRLTDSILIQIDLYTLSLFLNILLGGMAYTVIYAVTRQEHQIATALLNQLLYIGATAVFYFLICRRKRSGVRPYWFIAFSIVCCMLMMCNLIVIMPCHFTKTHAEPAFLLISAVSFLVLLVWLRERFAENEEKRELMTEIRRLSSQVHHYKEFIPAMKRKFDESLSLIRQKEKNSETARELRPMIDEIDRLYGEQIEESRLEFLEADLLPKTGLVFLDALLQRYHAHAKTEHIQFSACVFDSPGYLLEQKLITQLKLEELIGDLLTNAFRAIERKKIRKEESIEIIFGLSDSGFYEIDVYDSGEPFPKFVLEHFGRRGLTTGGTGEGIANMLEILQKYRVGLIIEEFSLEKSDCSKCITLRFGGNFEVTLHTSRNIQLKIEIDYPKRKAQLHI